MNPLITPRPLLASLLALAAAMPLLFTAPRQAHACGAPLPGLTGTVPAQNGVYPANAIIQLSGFDLDPAAQLTATIDGVPATAEVVSGLLPGTLGVRVSPEPATGQTVVVAGNICYGEGDFGSDTCKLELSYSAWTADTDAPFAPEIVELNVHDHVDFRSSGGDCQSSSDLAYHVHLTPEPELPPGAYSAPVYHVVEMARDAGFKQVLRSYTRAATDFALRLSKDELDGSAAAEAFCFRAAAIDASGNRSATSAVVCKPCFYRVDPAGTESGFTAPDEPAFTSSDVFAGGSCDTGNPPDDYKPPVDDYIPPPRDTEPPTSQDPDPRDPSVRSDVDADADADRSAVADRGCSVAGPGASPGASPLLPGLLALVSLLALRRRP